MRCSRPFLMLIVVMLGIFGAGCGIGMSGGRINFDDLKYPASMSGSLYGPDGEVVDKGGRLEEIDEFYYTKNYWSTFYSIIPLSRTSDIVEQMNKKIEKAGGDGITNVKVTSDYSKLTSLFPLNLLPIWPGCSEVEVTGTIVKFVGRK
jgi:hypothetical protein